MRTQLGKILHWGACILAVLLLARAVVVLTDPKLEFGMGFAALALGTFLCPVGRALRYALTGK